MVPGHQGGEIKDGPRQLFRFVSSELQVSKSEGWSGLFWPCVTNSRPGLKLSVAQCSTLFLCSSFIVAALVVLENADEPKGGPEKENGS